MKKLLYIIGGVVFLVIVIVIIGGSGEKKETTSPPKQETSFEEPEELYEEYFINFDISLEDRNFSLEGNTNLPNGSLLSIGVNRYVEYTELVGKRVVDLDNNKIKVQNGKFNYSTYLTDKKWYEEDLKENEILGIELKKIYEDCYVSITFTPARNLQPKEVYQTLGNNFENLNGEQVETSGDFKVIQLHKEFKLPIEEGIIEK